MKVRELHRLYLTVDVNEPTDLLLSIEMLFSHLMPREKYNLVKELVGKIDEPVFIPSEEQRDIWEDPNLKVKKIKAYRTLKDLGLKEAKNKIETTVLFEDLGLSFEDSYKFFEIVKSLIRSQE